MANVQLAVAGDETTQVILSVPGVQGPTGSSIPPSGTTNQVLYKQSSTDYDTGWSLVTSAMITDGTIVNGDINASAAIAGTKISPNFGSQNVLTTGTNTAASFIPTSSSVPTNGVYLPAANSVALSTNGTGRLFINSAGDIGIGWHSPSYDLHLEKDENALTTSYFRNINTGSSAGSRLTAASLVGNITFAAYSAAHSVWPATTVISCESGFTGGMVINAAGANPLRLFTDSTERLRITSTGQLSHIGAGSTGSPAVSFNGSAPSNSLVITSAGLVGIGTSSPSYQLTQSQANTVAYASSSASLALPDGVFHYLLNTDSTVDNTGCFTAWIARGTSSTTSNWYAGNTGGDATARSGAFVVGNRTGNTAYTERLRIDSSGRVGIGTTSPVARLETHVTSDGAESARFRISGLTNNPIMRFVHHESVGTQIDLNGTTSNATQLYVTQIGTERLRIDSSGRLLVGTSSARSNLLAGVVGVKSQIEQSAAETVAIIQNTTATNAASISLAKQKSGSVGGNTIVSSGDNIGLIDFLGNDGTNFQRAAMILAAVDGTPGANDMPGRLVFSVTADGAASPTEALRISSNRAITVSDGGHIVLGTGTGTKIGTSTSQKIGFFDETPIVQPTTGIAEAAFVENSGGTAVNVDSTFGGYTIQQVVQALQNLGLLA